MWSEFDSRIPRHMRLKLSLLLILYSAPTGFPPSNPAFFSPQNRAFDLLELLSFDACCTELVLQREID